MHYRISVCENEQGDKIIVAHEKRISIVILGSGMKTKLDKKGTMLGLVCKRTGRYKTRVPTFLRGRKVVRIRSVFELVAATVRLEIAFRLGQVQIRQ